MELGLSSVEMSREQEMINTKKRLEAFKFNPSTGFNNSATPSNSVRPARRPHMRSSSISSLSISSLSSVDSTFSCISESSSVSSMEACPSSSAGRSRPTHHRRRSSVNTHGESAELMGITLPELPVTTSQKNVNFCNNSFQRRVNALDSHEFSLVTKTVEIPILDSDGVPQKPVMRKNKLSTAFAISSVPGKRNSFGKLPPSNSPKVQLQTLVEEEEEEEDETDSTVSSCEDSIESEMHKEESEVQPVADIPKLRAHLKATHRRSLSRDGFFAARWLTDIITTLPISSLQLHYQS